MHQAPLAQTPTSRPDTQADTKRPSVSIRSIVLFAAMTLAMMILGASLLLGNLHKRELQRARNEIIGLDRALAEQTARALDGALLALRNAHERLSEGLGLQLPLDSLPVRMMLQSRAGGQPQLRSLFLLDHRGILANSSLVDARPNFSFADRAYFQYFADGGIDEVFYSEPTQNKIDGRWTLFVSRKLVDANQQFRGVIVASIELDYFSSLYSQIKYNGVDEIQLLDRHGHSIAAFPDNDAAMTLRASVPDEILNPHIPSAPKESVQSVGSGDERGFAAFRRVDKHPFFVRVMASEREILQSWRQVAHMVMAGVGSATLLILLVGASMIWNLRRHEALARALDESDERYRQLMESARDAIITLDENCSLMLANAAAERMFGNRAENLRTRPFEQLFADDTVRAYCARNHAKAEFPQAGLTELIGRHADGHPIPLEASFSTVALGGKHYVTMVLRDIAARKRTEKVLRETNQQLHELTGALQRVREEERAQMARELHDELGQLLIGIKLELSWLKRRLPPETEEVGRKFASVQEQLAKTIDSVRRLSTALRPLILDDLGLSAAINWLVADVAQRTGLEFDLDITSEDPQKGGNIATALFRIVQEALNNITKYAAASRVRIELHREDDGWHLIVEDDGSGFILDERKRAGFGLTGMRERATLLGGSFSITSAPDQGTRIETIIPPDRGQDREQAPT